MNEYMYVRKYILNQYVCKSTQSYNFNVDWYDENAILGVKSNVRKVKKKKGGGG